MEILFLLLIFFLLLIKLGMPALEELSLNLLNKKKSPPKDKYLKNSNFFSIAEKKFFDILNETIKDKFLIFPKVRVADLLFVKKDLNGEKNFGSFNKIKAKHVDYVVVRKEDCRIICAIELDDKSHNRSDRIKRDQFLDKAFETANLPLLRFKCKQSYSIKEIYRQLMPYLNESKTGK